jgi:dual specificity phosphatase 12
MDIPSQNIIQYFDESIAFIQETYKAGGRILIHCQAGVSRSATVLAACLMKSKNINRDDALAFIRKKRSVAPNTGFMDQLELYHDLGFDVDAKHVEYRRFLVAIMAEEQASKHYLCISIYILVTNNIHKTMDMLSIRRLHPIPNTHHYHPVTTTKSFQR